MKVYKFWVTIEQENFPLIWYREGKNWYICDWKFTNELKKSFGFYSKTNINPIWQLQRLDDLGDGHGLASGFYQAMRPTIDAAIDSKDSTDFFLLKIFLFINTFFV